MNSAPKNYFFSLILWAAKWKWLFWSIFVPLPYVVIYLVTWRKAALKSHFQFAVHQKRLKKQFFGAEYKIFLKRHSLRSKNFSDLQNLLAHPVHEKIGSLPPSFFFTVFILSWGTEVCHRPVSNCKPPSNLQHIKLMMDIHLRKAL